MNRYISIILLFCSFQSFSQVRLALSPNIQSAARKNTALIFVQLINYKGEDWFKENIFEPYYIKKTGIRYDFYAYYDGSIKIIPSKRLPDEIRQAFFAIEDSIMKQHQTIFGFASENYSTSMDKDSYIKFIKKNYKYAYEISLRRCNELKQKYLPLNDSIKNLIISEYPDIKPVFVGYSNLNPYESLGSHFYLSAKKRYDWISFYEFIKSAAVYNYIMPNYSDVFSSSLVYNIDISIIIKELENETNTNK